MDDNRHTAPDNPAKQSTASLATMPIALLMVVFWTSAASGQSTSNLLKRLEIDGGIPVDLPLSDPTDQPIGNPSHEIVRPRPRVLAANQSPAVAILTAESSTAPAGRQGISEVVDNHAAVAPDHVEPSPRTRRTIDEALQIRGSVTFRKTPLSEVVFLLSDLWQINIVAGDNVTGEVSGAFHDAPLHEVLTAVLSSAGYSYRKTGGSLVVLSSDQVGSDDPTFISATMALPTAFRDDPNSLEAAQLLLSQRGQLRRIGSEAVLVIDTADRIEKVRSLLAGFGDTATPAPVQPGPSTEGLPIPTTSSGSQPGAVAIPSSQIGIAYFTPQFVDAEAMSEPLQTAMGDQVIVAVFPEENRIMVKGTHADLAIANEAIEQLDRARPQVRISALIYDVSLQEVERLGINWSAQPRSVGTALVDINDPATLQFRNLFDATTDLITDTAVPGAGNLSISTINNSFAFDTLIQALDTSSESKLLADPTITVGDRREASIRIVQRIPILAADPVDNSGVVFSQVQFEEAGIILNVQPRISRDGTIDMRVQPEFSVVTNFIENNPVIDSRVADTTVRIGDGQTFAIGGLRQKTVIESQRGIPVLKDIKHIGKFFRSHDTEIRESELIVFIRPEVVTPHWHGSARENKTQQVIGSELDRIPHAQRCPLTPNCKDPNCPHHYPQPRINGGTEALRYSQYDRDYEVLSDVATQSSALRDPNPVDDYYPPVKIAPQAAPAIPLSAPEY